MKKMKQIPSASYVDQILVTLNGAVMVPNEDYVLDMERNNQVRFMHSVQEHSVIQLIVFTGDAGFDRTIISGKDYLAFHASHS